MHLINQQSTCMISTTFGTSLVETVGDLPMHDAAVHIYGHLRAVCLRRAAPESACAYTWFDISIYVRVDVGRNLL